MSRGIWLALAITAALLVAASPALAQSPESVIVTLSRAHAPAAGAERPTVELPARHENADPQSLIEQTMRRALGRGTFRQVMDGITTLQREAAAHNTTPNADQYFGVVQRERAAHEGQPGSAHRGAAPAPRATGVYHAPTAEAAQEATLQYGGIPGGIVLEGAASFDNVSSVSYDPRFNAFALDGAVYLVNVSPSALAALSSALAQDDRLGVSLGDAQIVYGAAPTDSRLALDLKIADNFLGDIVFAAGDWTEGYIFAGNYRPVHDTNESSPTAVFFVFDGFEFAVVDSQIRAADARLNLRLFPLQTQTSGRGDLQADLGALANNEISESYAANARHIADNVEYYRREAIIDQVFRYGEAAAFLRGLRAQGFDVGALAGQINGATLDGDAR